MKLKPVIFILAGGKSSRMGRDKGALPFKDESFVSHLEKTFRQAGFEVQTVTRDLVPDRGPVGGIFTALNNRNADLNGFLACDMPLVGPGIFEKLLEADWNSYDAAWACHQAQAGFPFVVHKRILPKVRSWVDQDRNCSLQFAAQELKSVFLIPNETQRPQLLNVNTTQDYECFLEFVRANSNS